MIILSCLCIPLLSSCARQNNISIDSSFINSNSSFGTPFEDSAYKIDNDSELEITEDSSLDSLYDNSIVPDASEELNEDEKILDLARETVKAMQAGTDELETILSNIDMELYYYEQYGKRGSLTDMMSALKSDDSNELSERMEIFTLPPEYTYSFEKVENVASDDVFKKAFEIEYAEKFGYEKIFDEFEIDDFKKVSFTVSYNNNCLDGYIYMIHIDGEWKMDMFFTVYAEMYTSVSSLETFNSSDSLNS